MATLIREARPLSIDDERLVSAYLDLGIPVDQLPYTRQFDRLVELLRAGGDQRTQCELLRRLMSLRKSARLPRLGRVDTSEFRPAPADVARIERMLREAAPAIGGRDNLPYSPEFEEMLERFNVEALELLTQSEFWRLIARVSKG